MNTTEINNYKQLQTSISLKKSEVDSSQLSLQVADEDLRKLNNTIANTEISVGLDLFQQKISSLSNDISGIETQLQDNLALREELQSSEGENEVEISNLEAQAAELETRKAILEQEIGTETANFTESQEGLNLLYAEKESKETFIQGLTTTYQAQNSELIGLKEQFEPISDPRTLVNAISDDSPFLLFPVRLETRFMTLKHVRKVTSLTDVPIEENTSSSTRSGSSSSIEELPLVPKIIPESEQVVEDLHELWVRVIPDDIVVHTHEDRLTLDELEAGKSYWSALSADLTDEESKLAAWRVIANSYSAERAAWIIKETTPTNINANQLPQELVFPSLTLKAGTWTDQPRSKVMPDRFVARVYSDDQNYREVVGELIPNPLPVGVNPSSVDMSTSFNQVDNKVDFPEELKWMTDFEKAEEVGMGIRIQLQGNERIVGFEKLFVLGLKLSEDKASSKDLIEELLNNHHYTNGFSLLPQGTPTNNTENVSSGYSSREIGHEASARTELGDSLYTLETERLKKPDGQWFSELLGLSNSTLEHVRFSDHYDQKEAMAMNTALWPATMGYYMKQMLTPLALNDTQKEIAEYYCNHVIARGRIPSFRVGNQPYGVLATTAFSKWKFSDTYEQQNVAVKDMVKNVLTPLSNEFDRLTENVNHSGPTDDVQNNFMKMLGLHASSVEYHQRFASGQYFSWNLLKYYEYCTLASNYGVLHEANVNSISLK